MYNHVKTHTTFSHNNGKLNPKRDMTPEIQNP